MRIGDDLDRSSRFGVSVQTDWACAWLSVSGQVDLATAPQLHDALAEALACQRRKVHVLLAQVTSIDSAGLSVLADSKGQAESLGFRLIVHSPNRLVREALKFAHPPSIQGTEVSRWTVIGLQPKACRQVPPETMFPDDSAGVTAAKRLCSVCPSRLPCLEHALRNHISIGVWGGKSDPPSRLCEDGQC